MTEISIIWDYSIAVHYFNSRRSNKSNETQLRNRSLSFKLESPKYIILYTDFVIEFFRILAGNNRTATVMLATMLC